MDFYLDIVSIEKSIFSGLVKKIQISGIEGDLGVYPGHVQLLSLIKPGIIHIFHKNNTEECLYISSGILEVQPSSVSVLADSVIRSVHLNRDLILQEKKIAKENMLNIDINRKKSDLLLEISQSVAKLRVLKIISELKNK